MVNLLHSFVLLLLLVSCSFATLFLNYEEDLRGSLGADEELHGEINALSGSIRKVFADDKGDRWTLYVQGELEHNLKERMIHQLYGRYKGPMGKWNLTLGRVPLPWGLLTSWSAERMPYSSPYKIRGQLKSDNGLLLSGTVGIVDYGLSLTQGYGMSTPESFPGLFSMRVGVVPLLSGDLTIGISGAVGTSHRGHGDHVHPVEHLTGGVDLTAYVGRGIIRIEAAGERINKQWNHQGFLELEYQLFPKLTLHSAGNLYSEKEKWNGTAFWGVSTKLKSVTIRGGYEYEKDSEDTHKAVLQLYRQLSLTR